MGIGMVLLQLLGIVSAPTWLRDHSVAAVDIRRQHLGHKTMMFE